MPAVNCSGRGTCGLRNPTVLLLAVICALLAAAPASAQTEPKELLELSLSELLGVRAVTGARHDQRLIDSPRAIVVITAEDIRRRNHRSTPEALSDALGVAVQQTNDGGGSPIIRGLIGNQILILIDGVRLNTAAYRLGPNQYLNTIDVNQIERIEVMRGAGSVLYGSDAMGGVVNIITKSALPTGPAVSTRLFTRFASADTGAVGRGEVSARAGAVSFYGGATGKWFGELRGGRDTGVQRLTGYDEWDTDAKLAVAIRSGQRLTLAAQRVTRRNIERADGVLTGTDLRHWWDPETRFLGYGRYDADDLPGPVRQFSVTASYQDQSEHYNRVLTAAPTIERQHADSTKSLGLGLQFASAAGPRHLLTYGADIQHDDISSRREDVSIVSGQRQRARGALADGSTYASWAIFVQDEFDVSARLHLNVGARYGSFRPDATATDPITGTIRINERTTSLTGTAFGLFRISSGVDLVGGIAQALRAPNIDDLTIAGSFGGGYEVPNPELDPENSVNVEAGLRGRGLRLSGSALYFVTDIEGLIERDAGLFQGKPFLDINGSGGREPGEPLVFQRQNAGRARVHGLELEGAWRVAEDWTLAGTFVRIIGEERMTGLPLRRVPPAQGLARIGWSGGGRAWAEGTMMFARAQTRLSPGDLTDIRIPAGGTPGFVALHARAGMTLTGTLQFTAGVQNVTNRSYRTHGSGLDMPGTNLILGVDWTF